MTRAGIVCPLIAFAALSMASSAEEPKTWVPNPKFSVEDGNLQETLTFISGMSYALTASKLEMERQGKNNFFCSPKGQLVGSKVLIDILNEKHQGRVTSEQVTSTVTEGLIARYPCKAQ